MKILRIVRWVASNFPSCPQSVQTTLEFFDGRLRLARHFKGAGCWGVQVNAFGRCWVNFRRVRGFAPRGWLLSLRLGAPIIQLGSPIVDAFKFVRVVSDRTFGVGRDDCGWGGSHLAA